MGKCPKCGSMNVHENDACHQAGLTLHMAVHHFKAMLSRNPIFAIVVLVIACIALKLFETWVNPWKCRDCSMTF